MDWFHDRPTPAGSAGSDSHLRRDGSGHRAWVEFPVEELKTVKALTKVRRFLVSEDGPTAVEYAVMLALILVACITIVTSLGTSVSGTFSRVNASMSS
jgi:pilus assembly protein Flp/PilA